MTDITDPADIIGVELVDEAVIDVLVSEGAAAPVEIPRYYLLLPTVTPAGTWQVGGVDTGIKAVGVDGQSADPAEVARIAAAAAAAGEAAAAAEKSAAQSGALAGKAAEAAAASGRAAAEAAARIERADTAAGKAAAAAAAAEAAAAAAEAAAAAAEAAAAQTAAESAEAAAAAQSAAVISGQTAAEAEKAAQSAEKAAALAAAISEQTALMPKFKEYQMAYVDRAAFSGTIANSAMVGIKFPRAFSRRPDYFMALLNVNDTIVRIAGVNNVTAAGFEVGLNYASSMRGVWYAAGVTED